MIDRLIERWPYLNPLVYGTICWAFAATGWMPGRWAAR